MVMIYQQFNINYLRRVFSLINAPLDNTKNINDVYRIHDGITISHALYIIHKYTQGAFEWPQFCRAIEDAAEKLHIKLSKNKQSARCKYNEFKQLPKYKQTKLLREAVSIACHERDMTGICVSILESNGIGYLKIKSAQRLYVKRHDDMPLTEDERDMIYEIINNIVCGSYQLFVTDKNIYNGQYQDFADDNDD